MADDDDEWDTDPDGTNDRSHYAGTGGQALRPPTPLTPRGWGYNVVKIQNSQAATYSFTVAGDAQGSEGAASHLEGRIVTMSQGGATYTPLNMSSDTDGAADVTVGADVSEVYLVVAAVPAFFGGNQTYGFEYTIARQ